MGVLDIFFSIAFVSVYSLEREAVLTDIAKRDSVRVDNG
jgi:hypothetical protein